MRAMRKVLDEGEAVRVLLAVDGSACSEAAICEVAARAWPAHTEIRVITAFELPLAPTPETWALPPDYFDRLDRAVREQAETIKDAAVLTLTSSCDPSIEVTGNILPGSPKSIILEEAERWDADLIVLGSHGYGLWQRFLLGSVSQAVVSHAKCSVEVVRIRNRSTAGEVKAA
jgi:nucleotide-binding universal stress UspA family protein